MPFDPNSPEQRRRRFRPIPLRMLVPNVITLLAICAGLTAIRLSTEGRLELALGAIVFAALLAAAATVTPLVARVTGPLPGLGRSRHGDEDQIAVDAAAECTR